MPELGTFSIRSYCRCGASMAASGAGDLNAADDLAFIFWTVHDGENHGPTDAKGAAAARRKQARRHVDSSPCAACAYEDHEDHWEYGPR